MPGGSGNLRAANELVVPDGVSWRLGAARGGSGWGADRVHPPIAKTARIAAHLGHIETSSGSRQREKPAGYLTVMHFAARSTSRREIGRRYRPPISVRAYSPGSQQSAAGASSGWLEKSPAAGGKSG